SAGGPHRPSAAEIRAMNAARSALRLAGFTPSSLSTNRGNSALWAWGSRAGWSRREADRPHRRASRALRTGRHGRGPLRGVRRVGKVVQTLEQRRNSRPDRPGIDGPVTVPPDLPVDGAGVQARPAPDAAEQFAGLTAENLRAPIVEKDQVDLFRPIVLTGPA